MMWAHVSQGWMPFCVLSALVVGISDVLWRTINNRIALTIWSAACCHSASASGAMIETSVTFYDALSASCLAFAVFFVFWAAGLVGGADVKICAAFAGWLGLSGLLRFVELATFCTGALCAAMLILSHRGNLTAAMVACSAPRGALMRAKTNKTSVPMGVPLAFAFILVKTGWA